MAGVVLVRGQRPVMVPPLRELGLPDPRGGALFTDDGDGTLTAEVDAAAGWPTRLTGRWQSWHTRFDDQLERPDRPPMALIPVWAIAMCVLTIWL